MSTALGGAIPGAELHILPGMGDQLPTPLWPKIISLIEENAARPLHGNLASSIQPGWREREALRD